MKKFKSLLALLLAVVMLCTAFAGCSKKTDSDAPAADVVVDPDAPAQAHESANGIMTTDNGVMRTELTSVELAHIMGNGINLGNTMEACDNNTGHVTDDTTYYERYWGAPITTQESIDGMKAAGFDTLRIPVAWMTNATDLGKNGDYTISEAYFNRVEEIINYALNADMYVVLNDHWDGGWYGMFGSEDPATRELAMEAYKGMWTQIANRYKEYGDRLIFEGANEEIGARFDENSALYCNDSTTNYFTDDEAYALANEVNQAFVDTVRATGGNNEQRFLLIPGFGTDVTKTLDERFVMPTDTAKNKLLVSVHYYDPSGYCIFESLPTWGTKEEYTAMKDGLAKMEKFTLDGYGVIIGECGAIQLEDGELKEGAVEWTSFFLDNCDLYGYCPVLWDIGGTYGSYDRVNAKMKFDDLAQVFLDHSRANENGASLEDVMMAAYPKVKETYDAVPETVEVAVRDDQAIAWIMYTSSDWGVQYSVGDTYSPTTATSGLVPTDVEITGAGTYTVSLDFTGVSGGYASSTAFTALGIANGELLFPGYYIEIKEIKINGEAYKGFGKYYTCSDDEKCTRVNLYNEWVPIVPEEGPRRADGDLSGLTATPLDKNAPEMAQVKTFEVTFEYVAPAA